MSSDVMMSIRLTKKKREGRYIEVGEGGIELNNESWVVKNKKRQKKKKPLDRPNFCPFASSFYFLLLQIHHLFSGNKNSFYEQILGQKDKIGICSWLDHTLGILDAQHHCWVKRYSLQGLDH